jgi:transcriptional regulator with AAA-type ATPase domain
MTQAGSRLAGSKVEDLCLVWRFPRTLGASIDLKRPQNDPADRVRELTVGRDPSSAVVLEGHDVSRRHAVLRWEPDSRWPVIVDLASRNGVKVNGRLVTAAALGAGDVVRVGGWVGVVTAAPGEVLEIAPGFWGGAALESAVAPLRRVAASDLPIVLEGETGTGKEVVTAALHRWSGRAGQLVAVNCAALPETLAEGELFGYRRGAFTGADRASPGFFRAAEGGTLLLDEVSDLPLSIQAKLLRVLEAREVQPLGESRPVAIDVRVVVAGQQRLHDSVRAGRFRADLLARLDGLTVRLPPLRQRCEDVIPLFSHLLESIGRGGAPAFESDVAERLCLHDWPFNVRELVLLVRRLLALHGTEVTLRAHHLPERFGDAPSADASAGSSPGGGAGAPDRTSVAGVAVEPVQLPALLSALRSSAGNVARAAAMLGISRQRAYRLMEGHAVDLEALRGGEPEKPP